MPIRMIKAYYDGREERVLEDEWVLARTIIEEALGKDSEEPFVGVSLPNIQAVERIQEMLGCGRAHAIYLAIITKNNPRYGHGYC